MPYRCSVPNCNGNYNSSVKVAVFGFPEEETLRAKWIHVIKRKNFIPTKSSKVCQLHFQDHEILWSSSAFDEKSGKTLFCRLKIPELVPRVIPSMFLNCPSYLSKPGSSRPSRNEILQSKEELQLRKAIEESKKMHEIQQKNDQCLCINDICEKLKLNEPLHILKQTSEILIGIVKNLENSGPHFQSALSINDQLELNLYMNDVKISKLGKFCFPLQVNSICQIEEVCGIVIDTNNASQLSEETFILTLKLVLSLLLPYKCESHKFFSVISFICEQIDLMTKRKMMYRYSNEFLIFASLLQNLTPHGYRFLSGGTFILPCYSTIRKVTLSSSLNPSNKQTEATFLLYLKQKFKALSESDKTIVLLDDEIHLKSFYDYKGGTVVRSSHNTVEAATTVFVFMVSSVFSSYKHVAHILPCRKMSADLLHGFMLKIIKGLEKLGFRVVAVITDNNAINRKAASHFSSPPKLSVVYSHPCNSCPLFFVLDTVRILKCIRNNWINLKLAKRCFSFPTFKFDEIVTASGLESSSASFDSLKLLHQLECDDSIVKFAYKISGKALEPSNLETCFASI